MAHELLEHLQANAGIEHLGREGVAQAMRRVVVTDAGRAQLINQEMINVMGRERALRACAASGRERGPHRGWWPIDRASLPGPVRGRRCGPLAPYYCRCAACRRRSRCLPT